MAVSRRPGGLKVKIKLGTSNAPGMNKRSSFGCAGKTTVSSKMMRCLTCKIEYQTPNELEDHLLRHIYLDERPFVELHRLSKRVIREETKIKQRRRHRSSWILGTGIDGTKGGTRMRLRRVNGNLDLSSSESLDSNRSETSGSECANSDNPSNAEKESSTEAGEPVKPRTELSKTVVKEATEAVEAEKPIELVENSVVRVGAPGDTVETQTETIITGSNLNSALTTILGPQTTNALATIPQTVPVPVVSEVLTDYLSSVQPLLVKSVSVPPIQFAQNARNQLSGALVQQNTLVQQHTTVLHQNMFIQQNWMPSPVNSVLLPMVTNTPMVVPAQAYSILTSSLNHTTTQLQQQNPNPPQLALQAPNPPQLALQAPNPQLTLQASNSQLTLQASNHPPLALQASNPPPLSLLQNPPPLIGNSQLDQQQQASGSKSLAPRPTATSMSSINPAVNRMEILSSATTTLKANLPSGYKCSMCSTQCMTKVELDLHTMSHKGSHLTCNVCGFVLSNYNAFKEHRLIHQSGSNSTSGGCVQQNQSKDSRLLPSILRRPILSAQVTQPEVVHIDEDVPTTSKRLENNTPEAIRAYQTVRATIQNVQKELNSSASISTIPINTTLKDVSIIPTNQPKRPYVSAPATITASQRVPVIQSVVSAGIASQGAGNNTEIQARDSAISQILKNQHLTVMPIAPKPSSSVTMTSSSVVTESAPLHRPPAVPTPLLRNKELTITPVQNNPPQPDVTCLGNFKKTANLNISIVPVLKRQDVPSTSRQSIDQNVYARRLYPGMNKTSGLPQLVPISPRPPQGTMGNYQRPGGNNPGNYLRQQANPNPNQKLPGNSGNYQRPSANSVAYQKLPTNPGSYQRVMNNPPIYPKPSNPPYSQPSRSNNGVFSKSLLLPGNKQFPPYPSVVNNRMIQNSRMTYSVADRNQQNSHLQQLRQVPLPAPRQVMTIQQPRMQGQMPNQTQRSPSTQLHMQQMARMEQMRQMHYSTQQQRQRQQEQQMQHLAQQRVQQQAQHQAQNQAYRMQQNYQGRYPGSNAVIRTNPPPGNQPPPPYPHGRGRPRLCEQAINVQSSCRYQNNPSNTGQYVTTTTSQSYPTSVYQQSSPQWHQPQYTTASMSIAPKENSLLMPPPSQPPPRLNHKYPTSTSASENSLSISYLENIIQPRAQDVESLTCGICSKDFANPAELSSHLVMHTKERETDSSSPDIIFCSTIAFSPMPHIKQERPPTPNEFEEQNDFGIVISSVRTLTDDHMDLGEEFLNASDNAGVFVDEEIIDNICENDEEVARQTVDSIIDLIEVKDCLIDAVESDESAVAPLLDEMIEIVASESEVIHFGDISSDSLLMDELEEELEDANNSVFSENDDNNSLVLSLEDEDFSPDADILMDDPCRLDLDDNMENPIDIEAEGEANESKIAEDGAMTSMQPDQSQEELLACHYCDQPFDKLDSALDHITCHSLSPADLVNESHRLCSIYYSISPKPEDKASTTRQMKRRHSDTPVGVPSKKRRISDKEILARSARQKYSYMTPPIRITCVSCGNKFGQYKVYLNHKRNCNTPMPKKNDNSVLFPLSTIPSSLRESSMVIPVLDLQKAAIDTLASCGVTTFIPLSCNGSNGGKCGLGIPALQENVLVNTQISNRLREMGVVNVVPLDS